MIGTVMSEKTMERSKFVINCGKTFPAGLSLSSPRQMSLGALRGTVLMLCEGSQEALCSGVAHAARRGSWQRQGTMSTGYQLLSCPQQHDSGAAVR